MLMKGLGMRGTVRHIKILNRSRGDLDNFNRPKPFLQTRDGGNHPMPLGVHGNGNFGFPPYMTDEDIALVGTRNLERHQGTSAGVPDSYAWLLFEHERSFWRRLGYVSPYKDIRGRAARDEREFDLWLHWLPDRAELKRRMKEDYNRRYVWPCNRIYNDSQQRSRLTGEFGNGAFRYNQDPYRRQRRVATSHKRPPHRQHRFIDIRDPRYRPPYPEYDMNKMQRGAGRPPFQTIPGRRDRHPHRHPAATTFPVPKATRHPPNLVYGVPGNSTRQAPITQPVRGFYLPTRHRRPHTHIYPDPDPRTRHRDLFVPRSHRPHRRYQNQQDEDDLEEEEEEDLSSQQSIGSFIRRPPSPRIVYPVPPPYHGRPLRHDRHETYTDDEGEEDDEDAEELFRRGGGYMGHRRESFALGHDGGGRFRRGPGGYRQRGGLEYGFSGDEGDIYGYG